MTPISQTQTPLPDPLAQTEALRAALDAALEELTRMTGSLAPGAAVEVCHMRDALAAPPEAYPGLAALDKALTGAIHSIGDLVSHADAAEVHQSLSSLRRVLLVDRSRFDPDPDTTSLSLAIALRRLWLIPHRAELLKAHKRLQQVTETLQEPDVRPDIRDTLLQTHSLLEQYISTQESYGASIRQELEELYRHQIP